MDISGAFILFFTVNVAPVCLYVLPYKYHVCVHFQRELEFLNDLPHYIGSLIQCTLSTELEVSSSRNPSQKLLSLYFYFVIEGISYGYLVPVLPVVPFLHKTALNHNFISSLLHIAGGVLALHYKTLIKVK